MIQNICKCFPVKIQSVNYKLGKLQYFILKANLNGIITCSIIKNLNQYDDKNFLFCYIKRPAYCLYVLLSTLRKIYQSSVTDETKQYLDTLPLPMGSLERNN